MKNLILFLLLAVFLAGCDKEIVTTTFKVDPLATINIKAASGVRQRAASGINFSSMIDTTHLTALEIVKKTSSMIFTMSNGNPAIRGFDPLQRDTSSSSPMLKMWATDIMYYDQLIDGTYTTNLVLAPAFLEAKNCLLIDNDRDTLAYIPNSVLRAAETRIKTFFTEMKYDSIYPVFNDAYTFIPITGAEYRALNQE